MGGKSKWPKKKKTPLTRQGKEVVVTIDNSLEEKGAISVSHSYSPPPHRTAGEPACGRRGRRGEKPNGKRVVSGAKGRYAVPGERAFAAIKRPVRNIVNRLIRKLSLKPAILPEKLREKKQHPDRES